MENSFTLSCRILKPATFLMCVMMLLTIQPGMAQTYYFRHYQVEDGLSHNSVLCSLQDEEGFMWFGTKNGLNRFDGYTFKIFRHDPADSNSLGSNIITTLFESDGKLWVGTDKGLYEYDAKTEDFNLLKVTLNSSIGDITRDLQHNLWFISDYTLIKYNIKERTLQIYSDLKYFNATALCSSPDGTIWVTTTDGTINKYNPKTDSFATYNLFDHSEKCASVWIEELYYGGNNTILAGTQSQGVKLFNTLEGTYQDVLPFDKNHSELFVRDILKSDDDEYWIATESGIFIYNNKTRDFINLKKSYNNPYAVSDNAIYTLCRDREGGIWAGTYFGGVNYYPRQYTPFEKFFPKVGGNSISGNAVREIVPGRGGNLWIGTEDGGLNKFNPSSGLFTNYMPTGNENSLSHYNIHGLRLIDEELWIGTFEHGLDIMDINTGKVIRHYSSAGPGALKSNFIYSFLQTTQNKVLVGSTVGLYKYLPSRDEFTLLPEFGEHHYSILLEDHQGTIWAGTYRDGLYFSNHTTGNNGFFKHDPGNRLSLSNNAINGLFEDSHHNLWITTEGGLNKLDRETGTFKRYTTNDGFPSNVIYSIQEDDQENLWISTARGLVKFDPVSEKVKVFTKAHGLLGDQFNYSSSYKDRDGRMYFGSVSGMIRFDPAEFIRNTYIPPICITGFQIHNREVPVQDKHSPLQKSITYTDKIILNHNQSSFSVDFAALSYTAPKRTEYTYKMEGLDKGWTYLKTNRKVYFTELAPGNYTFKVKAANSSGLWNDKATTLEIEILPPFWASYWFYLLYGILGAAIIFYLIYSYHQRTKNKSLRKIRLLENEKEKEIYQAKIEFFTNVAHEIRTPLTLIKGPLEKLIKTTENVPEITDDFRIMKKNTDRLLDLSNQLLDFRKTEIKGFTLTFVKAHVSDLLKDTYSRFRPVAEQKGLNFIIDLPAEPLYAYVDPEALTKILSNLFNNAVKYAESNIWVTLFPFTAKDEMFLVVVKNDGEVIPSQMKEKIFEPFFCFEENKNKTGTGIGLPLARSLAELHTGTLQMDQVENKYNSFILTLPIHQEKAFKLYSEEPEEAGTMEIIPAQEEDVSHAKPVILLVEDNKEMIEFISRELTETYTVIKTSNGERALAILEKNMVQLVVSDIMMPVMDGFELCRQIKTNLDYSHIPVILLTAKSTMKAKIEGLESGADAYIEKPFSPEHLQVQITNLLSNRNKIKTYFSSSPLAHMKDMAYSKADEKFLKVLNDAIYNNIADTDLNVEHLAEIMNMSRPTLYRKIKGISDLTPNELITIARLKKAAELLREGNYKIYEIANIVGYNSQTSFGRNFHKQFGMSPSEYAATKELHEKAQ